MQVVVYGLDGRVLTSYRAYSDALGIKSVAWSPSGQLLAVGSYDQVCGGPTCAQGIVRWRACACCRASKLKHTVMEESGSLAAPSLLREHTPQLLY